MYNYAKQIVKIVETETNVEHACRGWVYVKC